MKRIACPVLLSPHQVLHFIADLDANLVMVTKSYLVSEEYCKSFCFGEGCKYWKGKCEHHKKITVKEAEQIVRSWVNKYKKLGFKVIK